MIGIFGIFARERDFNRKLRIVAFERMANSIDKEDFCTKSVHGDHYSIGIVVRKLGKNMDLALKVVDKSFVVGFSGYGKVSGEKELNWAENMINEILLMPDAKRHRTGSEIEGSFELLMYREGELTIVSDRFGSKNHYYYDIQSTYVFAPSVGMVLSSELVRKEKDLEAVKQVLVAGFFLDDKTLVKNIHRFPYGSRMTKKILDHSDTTWRRYWTLPTQNGRVSEITPKLLETFSEKTRNAINELADLEDRFIVPLSGGLDSRLIACYLSEKYALKTITYDTREEARIAAKVCKHIGAEFKYISNEVLIRENYRDIIKRYLKSQPAHCVINQIFYIPFYKIYFRSHPEKCAIFDGIYLDELFSCLTPKPDRRPYDFGKFLKTYGGGTIPLIKKYLNVDESELEDMMEQVYWRILCDSEELDDIAKSQLFYVTGRLRRFVNESVYGKEDYCYIFKPGYNYELIDFAFGININLRTGKLYRELFLKDFMNIMKIKYKDSYGNRKSNCSEKLKSSYSNFRLRLFDATNGRIKYSVYQINNLFVEKEWINDFSEEFFGKNYIDELISNKAIEGLFSMVKKKHYLFNLFQRILFIQQFYRRYGF